MTEVSIEILAEIGIIMINIIQKYTTGFLVVVIITMFLSLAGTGYLYKESLKQNGRLETTISILRGEIETCRADTILMEADRNDLELSLDIIQKKYDTIKERFESIEHQLSIKQCRGNKNEKPVDINAADDIADTLRLLREASCLSNKDCERP